MGNDLSKTSMKMVLQRAAFFFGSFFALFILTVGWALVAGVESGELQEKVIAPVKAAAENARKAFAESDSSPAVKISNDSSVIVHTSSTITVNGKTYVNTKQKTGAPLKKVEVKWVYPTIAAGKSYEETKKEVDAWWQQIQNENEAKRQQDLRNLNTIKQQNEESFERFKKESQQKMEDFKKQTGEQQRQFLQEHGITP